VVIKPSIICHIERATLVPLLQNNSKLGFQFLKQAAIDLGDAEEDFIQSFRSAKARLAHAILSFRRQYSKQSSQNKLEIELPLRRNDLAAMAGIHPESVTKVLRVFKREGIAELTDHTLKISNIDQLFSELDQEYI